MTGRPQKKPPTYIPGVVEPMEPLLTRHSIQILRQAGHTQDEVAKYSKIE